MDLINTKEFAKAALVENFKTFIIYMTSFNLVLGIYLDKVAQIASLLIKEVKILDKFSDFVNIFSDKKVIVLLEQSESY